MTRTKKSLIIIFIILICDQVFKNLGENYYVNWR
jgi:hypothetical protein